MIDLQAAATTEIHPDMRVRYYAERGIFPVDLSSVSKSKYIDTIPTHILRV